MAKEGEKACVRYTYVYVQVVMTFQTFLWHDVCTGIDTRNVRRLARTSYVIVMQLRDWLCNLMSLMESHMK